MARRNQSIIYTSNSQHTSSPVTAPASSVTTAELSCGFMDFAPFEMDDRSERLGGCRADDVDAPGVDRGSQDPDLMPYISPRSSWKKTYQGEIIGDDTPNASIDSEGEDNESTCLKDTRAVKSILRGDDKESMKYSTNNLINGIPSAIEPGDFRQDSQSAKSTTGYTPLQSFSSQHQASKPPFSVRSLQNAQTTPRLSSENFVTVPLIEEQYELHRLPVSQIFAGQVQQKAKPGVLRRLRSIFGGCI
ncbi:hypothetical protein AOQ84DRAFT_169825 [Glonium stellatum]|uniref:Uncharacterized protein n=1 Tax=Glonium stellatum TaxID=574774 RepID=A0A8E2JMN6_9PEZI|nr:hypothetical protein AOQ84DRAFT_169825 [Glonium stellatum]